MARRGCEIPEMFELRIHATAELDANLEAVLAALDLRIGQNDLAAAHTGETKQHNSFILKINGNK